MNQPRLREYESLFSYRLAYEQYIEEQYEDGTSSPHHTSEHPVVLHCPLCNSPARIMLRSDVDNPVWTCMTAPAPGHYITIENGSYVADEPGR